MKAGLAARIAARRSFASPCQHDTCKWLWNVQMVVACLRRDSSLAALCSLLFSDRLVLVGA